MPVSKEYEELIKELRKPKGIYEKFCELSEKFPIKPGKELEKKYREAINFAHLEISPRGAFSFAVIASISFFIFCSLFSFFHFFSLPLLIIIAIFSFLIFYYLYDYPFHLATQFRIEASSEMVLGIIYMTIAMRVTPNLENAIKFAASNLSGPLGYDLKKMIWDIYTGKYTSVSDALDDFGKKWRRENEEFIDAINIIQTSLTESTAKREKILDKAVDVMLTGTRERMKKYAHELRTPVSVINTMGILLPIIGLIFFPMLMIFLPDLVKPIFLAVGYNVILPITVFWIMKSTLEKRPYSFHQPDISRHPKFAHEKPINRNTILAALVPFFPTFFALYMISTSNKIFGFDLLLYSLLIICSGVGGIVFYCIFSTIEKIKLREEITTIESEFDDVLFQLGSQLERGVSFESALKNITPQIKDLKVSKFFDSILRNIENFGLTLEKAIFDKNFGAIRYYPSRLIEAVMKALCEISKRGMAAVSKAMLSISNYLKDIESVEAELKGVLSESTSDMQIQAYLLAPLTAAMIVSMTAAMMQLMLYFSKVVEKLQAMLTTNPAAMAGNLVLTSMMNINRVIPIHWFQLIVGVYVVEIVSMLAVFMSIINNGEENLLKRFSIGKILLIATFVYVVLTLLIYLVFNSIMPSLLTVIG
jgi:hypothetical protein